MRERTDTMTGSEQDVSLLHNRKLIACCQVGSTVIPESSSFGGVDDFCFFIPVEPPLSSLFLFRLIIIIIIIIIIIK